MLSRVADSLYWMSRYLERAEHTARLIDVNLNLALELPPQAASNNWRRVLAALRAPGADDTQIRPFNVTQYLAFDESNPDSLVTCITSARENARQVREQVSTEMWEQINRLYLQVKRSSTGSMWSTQPHEYFRAVKEGAYLFHGIIDSTMSHGDGWHFIQLGRYSERAGATARLLDVYFGELEKTLDEGPGPDEFLRWVGLLRSCSAFEAYCQFYTADLRSQRIIDFLLLNPDFPRSVRYSVGMVRNCLKMISSTNKPPGAGRADRISGRLCATLDYGHVDEIISDNLHNYLDNIQRQCQVIHTAVRQAYIAYSVEAALAS
jgi:uncharacterized alpha-E superfamily protein